MSYHHSYQLAILLASGVLFCHGTLYFQPQKDSPRSQQHAMMKVLPVAESVVCPEGRYVCPDFTTCCLISAGVWACCPLPDAVCCSDHIHCCPEGTTCNLHQDTCDDSRGHISHLKKKIPAKLISEAYVQPWRDFVQCPDASTFCRDPWTCCRLPNGTYNCCRIPEASCCSDGLHCCPQGTTCDLPNNMCHQPGGTGRRQPALATVPGWRLNVNQACPDGGHCLEGETCCPMSEGRHGCCPATDAVCCSDFQHCCPRGSRCKVSAGVCLLPNGLETPVLRKYQAFFHVEP